MDTQTNSLVNLIAKELAKSSSVQKTAEEFRQPLFELGAMFRSACSWIQKTIQEAQESHLRQERLVAYQSRHRWKISDVQPLLSHNVNGHAHQRMARLKGKGRPVVQIRRPLGEAFFERLAVISSMFRDDATPDQRRRSFRAWPWWKHHVEAYYRGEYAQAKLNETKAPSDHAERLIGSTLGMSQGSVRAACNEIRALRRRDPDFANFPARTLDHYKTWMRDGWPYNQIDAEEGD